MTELITGGGTMELLQSIRWLFLDPSVLFNESVSEREARQRLAALLARRGRPVSQEQIERAWMQAIAAPQPIHPLLGAIRLLTPDPTSAGSLLSELLRQGDRPDLMITGLQLALQGLQARFKLGVIGPHRLPGARASLERYHLHFPVVALGEELQLSHRLDPGGRPDPALFTWALRKVGCPAKEAAFASGRVDLGLAPAKLAGLSTIWLRQTNHKLRYPRTTLERPDLTFNSLPDLARALRT